MAFEGLTGRLSDAFSSLRKKGKVTETDIDEAMREVRLALLEADVNFKVVKNFVKTVKEKAKGEEVIGSLTGGQQVVKIVNDELTDLMGGELKPLNLSETSRPTVFMMSGLQGSGKTTTAGKLANYLRKSKKMKPLLVAGDIYRPAAIDQLKTVGAQLSIPVFEMGDQVSPVEIARKGLEKAEEEGHDLVIIDTAGRLHIDEELMNELVAIRQEVEPDEVFLVVDAMTGQDAVNVAEAFDQAINISSVILTKLDGDTRGGAALSISAVTGKPIKFAGSGEKLSDLEPFHPDRMANRILGMGDILTLIERAEQEVSEEEALALADKMRDQTYDFNDFLDQMDQVSKLGPMQDIIKMIPGLNKIPGIDDIDFDDGQMDWTRAIIYSMTEEERGNPDLISQSRRRRIAAGSGRSLTEVNGMIKQFNESKKMMSSMSGGKGSSKMEKMMKQMDNAPGMKGGGKKNLGKGKDKGGLMSGLGDLFGGNDQMSQAMKDQNPKPKRNKKKKKKKVIRKKR